MSKRPGDPGYAAGWCIHYLGISDGKGGFRTSCEKGVDYSTFKEAGTGFTHRAPCFLTDKGESKPDAMQCEHLRRPTREEIIAHEVWIEQRWGKMTTVLAAIEPWRKANKDRAASQTINCPACSGKLTLSMRIAASNGHVHGHCKTDGCVSWME